jgi:hypothetical protein
MRLGHVVLSTIFCLPIVLTGCALQQTAAPAAVLGIRLTGSLYGGQQPIVGAHVYLFAANTTGYAGPGIAASGANASLSLLNATATGNADSIGAYVLTGTHGNFTITGDYVCTPNTQVYLYALGGNPGAGVNSAAGLMTALGNCPSSGSFLASIPRIQVNEVTTIAAAYAMAGFATDATHVSSSGTPLAQTGIANAFANATNLADITTGAALSTTPAGNGLVPQSTINTLADILASCINSTSPASHPCSTLLSSALSGGSAGTQPTDTATAALNIAHNPTANIAALFALQPPDVPFQPTLASAPNDFTIGLFFDDGDYGFTDTIAIDASGNAWTVNFPSGVSKFSSSGALLSPPDGFFSPDMTGPSGIAIDSFGNAWVVNSGQGGCGQGDCSVSKFSPSGDVLSGGHGFNGLSTPKGIAIDAADNVWVADAPRVFPFTSSLPYALVEFSNAGTILSPVPGGFPGGGLNTPETLAIDGSGDIWIGNDVFAMSEFSHLGTPISPAAGYRNGFVATSFPGSLAIDSSGNVWAAGLNSILEFSNAGILISPAAGFPIPGQPALDVSAIAIDGGGNVWGAEYEGFGVVEFAPSGSLISPAVGYNGGFPAKSSGIAIDGSGNVWIANPFKFGATELIGAAVPVVTPLSAGVKNNSLGTRP